MKNKNLIKLIINYLDGEINPKEELLLEKECLADQWLAEEKDSFEKVVSLLKKSRKITPSPGFTEKVMAQIEKKPVCLKRKIYHWIWSPLDVHLNWVWKWSMAFSLVFLVMAGVSWQYSRMERLYSQMGRLEQQVSNLKNQSIPTRFVFYCPKAQSVHLAGTFNNWQANDQSQLINLSGEGIWSITVPLKPGQYEYMFVVDEKEWVTDPGAMDFHSDGFGRNNSIVEVFQEI